MTNLFSKIAISLMLFCLSGCATKSLLKDVKNGRTDYYNLSEYSDAFLSDSEVVVNYKASTHRNSSREKSVNVSAFYPINKNDFLPSNSPRIVSIREKDSDIYKSIPIEYVEVPDSDIRKSRVYNSVSTTNSQPVIIIARIGTSNPSYSYTHPKFNSQYCMYVHDLDGKSKSSVVLSIRSYAENKNTSYKIVFIPATIVVDVITLPFQLFAQLFDVKM